MSLNSSSNNSLLYSNDLLANLQCLFSRPSSIIFTSFTTTYAVLLLPLCIFIIYHGLQQWWKKRSASSAAPMSHSDSFTYHLVTMETFGVFGCILCCCGIHGDQPGLAVSFSLYSLTWFGEVFFHILTCVERYLAVVHPVTYLSLRRERGIRIRNIAIGCIWLLSFVLMSVQMFWESFIIMDFCLLILSLTITSFCSLSVLCVLIRPGPGEQGGGRERVDQSKQRAFYTIVAILGVLVIRFTGGLIYAVLHALDSSMCVILTGLLWFNLPSSLVLPLLFLHREGKLVCWRNI